MPEISKLEPVNLRDVWAHEAHHFTPWLAENIDQLGDAIGLNLKDVTTEKTLGGMGRVDIFARQEETDAIVVIENQIEKSDHGHCLSLIGYAAGAEASILVWIASDFDSYHRTILEWLNESDTINVYAVKVSAYSVKGNYTYKFQTVVAPESPQGSSQSKRKTTNTLYAEFYRPLNSSLIEKGFTPISKGGWRGRWRSFQSGLQNVCYATRAEDLKAQVFLSFNGESNQTIFNELKKYQTEIDSKLNGKVIWKEFENGWSRIILKSPHALSIEDSESKLNVTRQWMLESLMLLRNIVQPYLDKFKSE